MSMGPKAQEEIFESTFSDKANIVFRKVIHSYVDEPVKNLLYFSLLVCMVGLAFGRSFPLPFYVILGILAIVEAYKYFVKKSEDQIIIKEVQK